MDEPRIEVADKSLTRSPRGAETIVDIDPRARGSVRRPLLSPAELAAYLGVPLATVYRWRSRREGPCGIRVGRHVRYRVTDVERWLDDQREHRP
jgi:excisionase family DNA binding protein